VIFSGLEYAWGDDQWEKPLVPRIGDDFQHGQIRGYGYGINYNMMELKSMDSSLLRSEGPEYDIHSQSFNAVVSTLSNLLFKSPRNFFKVMTLAA
jgi:hypothetical protein